MSEENKELPDKSTVENAKKRKPAEPTERLTIETARALLGYQEKKRADDCRAELEKLLNKYNCQLSGAFVFDGSGPRLEFKIVALPEK